MKTTDYARVDYAKKDGSWTVNVEVDSAGSNDYHLGGNVVGESDTIWFAYQNLTGDKCLLRDLPTSDVLGTELTVSSASIPGNGTNIGCDPVYYDDGGVERITVIWSNGGDNLVSREVDDGTVQGASEEDTLQNTLLLNAWAAFLSSAVLNKKVFLIFRAAGDADLDRIENEDSGGWSSETSVHASITTNSCAATVFIRDGNYKLAMLYEHDGGPREIYYNEVDLGAADVGPDFLPLFGVKQRTILRM